MEKETTQPSILVFRKLFENIHPSIYNNLNYLLKNGQMTDIKLKQFRTVFENYYPEFINEFEQLVEYYNKNSKSLLYTQLMKIIRSNRSSYF